MSATPPAAAPAKAPAKAPAGEGVGGRATPFYCPYCGETDIRPGEAHGVWECAVCDRLWALSYRGPASGPAGGPAGGGAGTRPA